jgi:hypothetical protein
MGVLEEAIRDHLELRRKHGASDEELRREEAEALGPARRDLLAPEEEPEALVEPATGEAEEEEVEAGRPRTEEIARPESEEPEEPVKPQVDEPLELDEPWRAEEESASRPEEADAGEPEEPFPGETPPSGLPPVTEDGTPFEEQEPSEEQREDVLEETPDFLQETPEHDKLWFEQKPPRDFDFD